MAHSQNFYKQNLPSLTDFRNSTNDADIENFLLKLVFSNLQEE